MNDERLASRLHEVACAQEHARIADAPSRRADARARLLERAAAGAESRRPQRIRWAIGGVVGVAAAALVLVVALRGAYTLTFELGPDGQRGVVGAWLAAPTERDELLRFSDGSEITLAPQSRARVAELDRHGARVVLERGSLDVRIEHDAERTWQIDAGPYRVLVTGTSFDVAWDPQREAFELDLREGAVIVEGPRLDGAQAVRAGQLLKLAGGEATSPTNEVAGFATPVDDTQREAITPAPTEPAPTRVRPSVRAAREPVRGVMPAPAWRELADGGKYADALAAAELAGWAELCADLSSTELLRLADVARFARRPARAVEALTAVRRRFPDTDDAAIAAFERGRMALGGRPRHDEAVKWLEIYLDERPSGALAREATGRLVEALDGAGRSSAARDVARKYLAEHPTGPHADLAARVLAGER